MGDHCNSLLISKLPTGEMRIRLGCLICLSPQKTKLGARNTPGVFDL